MLFEPGLGTASLLAVASKRLAIGGVAVAVIVDRVEALERNEIRVSCAKAFSKPDLTYAKNLAIRYFS